MATVTGTTTISGTNRADVIFANSAGSKVISAMDGDDKIFFSLTNDKDADVIDAGAGNDVVSIVGNTSTTSDVVSVYLGDGNDKLTVTGSYNTIFVDGGAGNDTIIAGNGRSYISGGTGNDLMVGSQTGTLNEFDGDAGADTIVGNQGGGANDVNYTTDTVGINVNLSTGVNHGGFAEGDVLSNISSVTAGSGNDTLTANDKGDGLNGYLGNDVLVGGAGNDYLTGGAGSDTLTGGAGNDIFFVSVNSTLERDYITDFVLGQDKIGLTGVTFADLSFSYGTDEKNVHGTYITNHTLGGSQSGLIFLVGEEDLQLKLTASDFIFQ